MKHRVVALLTIILAALLSQSTDTYGARQLECADSVWVLATNEYLFEARLVAFDPCRREVIEELTFPPHLSVVSAQWSPDGKYIAAILGAHRPTGGIAGMGLGLFASDGKQIIVREFEMLTVRVRVPASVVWSADSRVVYFAIAGPVDDAHLSTSASVMSLDVTSRRVRLEHVLDFSPLLIQSWEWAPGGSYAFNLSYPRWESPVFTAVELQPQPEYVTLPENVWAFDVSSGGILYLTDTDEAFPELHLARLEDGSFTLLGTRGQPTYLGVPQSIRVFALSDNGELVAFQGIGLDPSISVTPVTRLPLYILRWDTDEVTPVDGEYLAVDQIVWSPDNTYFAARTCDSSLAAQPPYDCQVRVFSLGGEAMLVPTGDAETRDPMWMPAGRARP